MIKRRELIRNEESQIPVELLASKKVTLLHTKKFQPVKTADQKHHGFARINKNFLPILFNPTEDKTITFREAKTSIGNISVMAVDLVTGRNNTTTKKQTGSSHTHSEYAHLPTRAEYQILMGLLIFANHLKTPKIEFESWTSLLTHLGLLNNTDNRELVKNSLEVFTSIYMRFEKSYIKRDPNSQRLITCCNKVITMTVLDQYEFGNKINGQNTQQINIEFNPKFFQECWQGYFVQNIDVTKLMQFRSPYALSIYLYLMKWCKVGKVDYMRKCSEPLNFLYDYLGWAKPAVKLADGTPNPEAYPSRVKGQINKALEQIMLIDERFNLELDAEQFVKGRVQFNLLPVELRNERVVKPYDELTINDILALPKEYEWLVKLGYSDTDIAFIKVSQELKRKM